MRWVSACRLDALAARAVIGRRVAGRDLILVRDGHHLYAADRACPHEGADLAEGQCAGGRLRCPRHFAWFDLERGGALSPGWSFPGLRTYAVRARDGEVWVEVEDG